MLTKGTDCDFYSAFIITLYISTHRLWLSIVICFLGDFYLILRKEHSHHSVPAPNRRESGSGHCCSPIYDKTHRSHMCLQMRNNTLSTCDPSTQAVNGPSSTNYFFPREINSMQDAVSCVNNTVFLLLYKREYTVFSPCS